MAHPMATINSDNYHDYVIKDGKFIGEFEQMYRNCSTPWPETEKDVENLPTSARTPVIITNCNIQNVYSLGCGKGMHLNWLSQKCPGVTFSGCDIAPSAVEACKRDYPHLAVTVGDIDSFMHEETNFDLLLLREVVWYFLDKWESFCTSLQRYKGKHIIIELSFYDDQKYGTEHFDGPDDFINKFPFKIIEIVRFHTSKTQRNGMILLHAQI